MRRLRTSGLQFVLALLLSLALWTFVSFTQNPTRERRLDVPVEVIPPPPGLVVVDPTTGLPAQPQLNTTLQVTVADSDLGLVNPQNFKATANLSGSQAGDQTVPIDVDPPTGVRIRTFSPTSLRVRLVAQSTRALPIQVTPRNQPAFLFAVGDFVVDAKEAIASGPAEMLSRVDRVIAPIDLAGRTSTFVANVALEAVDRGGSVVSGITLSPAATSITIPINPRAQIQRVSVVPRIIGQPAPGYTNVRGDEGIDWNPKYVELIAPFLITGTLGTETIDLTGRTESFTETVKLDAVDPSWTLITSDQITVTVPVVPFQTPYLAPVFVPVTPINQGTDLNVTVQPLGLSITARGTAEQFKQLESNPVEATVDVRGLGPGTYSLAASVALPGGLTIVGNQPQVTVTIVAAPTSPAPSPAPSVPGG